MKARYYGAGVGRFVSADSGVAQRLDAPPSWNRYSYALNSPISNFDPNGQEALRLGNLPTFNGPVFTEIRATLASYASTYAGTPLGGASYAALGVFNSVFPSNQAEAVSAANSSLMSLGLPLEVPSVLPDSAFVVRGGIATEAQLSKGAEISNANGTVSGVSVNSASGSSVQELSRGIPNKTVSVTTVGEVRATGGDVVPTPSATNPCHCDMNNIDPKQISKKFEQQPNPTMAPPSPKR
jgi:hypothetical protein